MIRIDQVFDPALAHFDDLGYRAVLHRHGLLQALEQPDARIIAGQDSGRLEAIDEQRDEVRKQAIDALHERLENEVVTIAIDDQSRQPVGLAVDHPIGCGVDAKRLPVARRRVHSTAP